MEENTLTHSTLMLLNMVFFGVLASLLWLGFHEFQLHLNTDAFPHLLAVISLSLLLMTTAYITIYKIWKKNKNAKKPDALTIELQQALANQEFVLHYQPIVNTKQNKISGVEALLRWQNPKRGLLTPSSFLIAAEKSGLMIPLGAWVLRSACVQAKKWHAQGYTDLFVSVNFSPSQFNDPNLYHFIDETLKQTQLPPQALKIEIVESAIMLNVEANILLLQSLQKLGVQLSLDDFGTGYSSLSYLKNFPFSFLKMDKSFIADIATTKTSVAIVEAIITLSKSLDLTLIAEGVENELQSDMLKERHCHLHQGYFYGKPLSAEALNPLLRQ